MPDVESILRSARTSDRLRAAAWDAFQQSANADELAQRLMPMELPQETKAQLWDLKSGTAKPFVNETMARSEDFTEQQPEQTVGRFLSNAASMVLPSTTPSDYIEGPLYALRHPIDSAKLLGGAVVDSRNEQLRKAAEARAQGRTSEAIGHRAAAAIPLIGPAAAAAGEQIGLGDVAGGLGSAAGLLAPSAVAAGRGPLTASVSERMAARAERGAQRRVAEVISPKVGANKTRFGNQAQKVGGDLAKEPGLGAASREGLQNKVEGRLAEAEAALDAADDAKLALQDFPTDGVLSKLQEARDALAAQAIEADLTKPQTISQMVPGEGQVYGAKRGTPIGKDVVPSPHAGQVAMIDRAIQEVKALGPRVRYEALRRIRAAYDPIAKAVYAPSVTADYMAKMGEKIGASKITGALRDYLAEFSPRTAEANSRYHLFRTASDVLHATEEVQRVRPGVGRKMLTSAVTGGAGTMISPGTGTAIGIALGPLVDSALQSGVTTKIGTARLLSQYADAIRKGQFKRAGMIQERLKQAGVAAGRLQRGQPSRKDE